MFLYGLFIFHQGLRSMFAMHFSYINAKGTSIRLNTLKCAMKHVFINISSCIWSSISKALTSWKFSTLINFDCTPLKSLNIK